MTNYTYYNSGQCIGIPLARASGVFEKCSCPESYLLYKNCSKCLKSGAMERNGLVPLDLASCVDESQLNNTEVKNES
ncbi:MAG: hypothetical protein AABX17_02780 [Nanoarchaeota archaeon]